MARTGNGRGRFQVMEFNEHVRGGARLALLGTHATPEAAQATLRRARGFTNPHVVAGAHVVDTTTHYVDHYRGRIVPRDALAKAYESTAHIPRGPSQPSSRRAAPPAAAGTGGSPGK